MVEECKMEVFQEYLAGIDNLEHRTRLEGILNWISKNFPDLKTRIAWNQPMFTDHGTFIIGFSVSKHHLAIAPEKVGINMFYDEIVHAGYNPSQQLIRIRWEDPVDFSLLEKIIAFNILDKAETATFWRK